MSKAKRHSGKEHIVVRTEGTLRKNWEGTDLGFVQVKKHVGFNARKRAVFLCEDIFGTNFFCCGGMFNPSMGANFKERVWHKDSIKKLKKLRKCYNAMIDRCYNPDSCNSRYYHDEGVTVCDQWLGENGLFNFVIWAVASGWNLGLTIDKSDKRYSPATCKWSTRSVNSRYTRNTLLTEEKVTAIKEAYKEFSGVKLRFYEQKALEYGVSWSTIRAVINKNNWVHV